MGVEIDWPDELDGAIRHVPDRPAGHYLASGHRAVRRRRLVTASVGLVAAVAIGGAAWSTVPRESSSSPPIATRSPGPTVERTVPDGTPESAYGRRIGFQPSSDAGDFTGGAAFAVQDHDTWLVRAGWQVDRFVASSFPPEGRLPAYVGAELTETDGRGGQWVVVVRLPDGTLATTWTRPAGGGADFRAWVKEHKERLR